MGEREQQGLSENEAVALAKSGWWKDKTPAEVVRFQLYEDRLVMDWADFQGAVEKVLGRPVWTHEFADPELLRAEFEGTEAAPEDPVQHALDTAAAMLLAHGKDPDEAMIPVFVEPEEQP